MHKAAAGKLVKLFIDGLDEAIEREDQIETSTGRRYRVVTVRRQARGRHIGRQHVRGEVLEEGAPRSSHVHRLTHWYPRVSF